jgi:hypothetical protein
VPTYPTPSAHIQKGDVLVATEKKECKTISRNNIDKRILWLLSKVKKNNKLNRVAPIPKLEVLDLNLQDEGPDPSQVSDQGLVLRLFQKG